MKADPKKNFVRLAEKRVNKTLHEIRLIGNLSNRTNYNYDSDQVAKIIEALEAAVAECKTQFENNGRKEEELFRL